MSLSKEMENEIVWLVRTLTLKAYLLVRQGICPPELVDNH